MEVKTVVTKSAEETELLGESIAKYLKAGDVLAFIGGLGMGKTALTRGIAKGLHYNGDVLSPTFTIINEYRGGTLNICHMDAYRLESSEGLFEIGFYDYCDNGWVSLIEWSENIKDGISPDFTVSIKRIDDNIREITVTKEK